MLWEVVESDWIPLFFIPLFLKFDKLCRVLWPERPGKKRGKGREWTDVGLLVWDVDLLALNYGSVLLYKGDRVFCSLRRKSMQPRQCMAASV